MLTGLIIDPRSSWSGVVYVCYAQWTQQADRSASCIPRRGEFQVETVFGRSGLSPARTYTSALVLASPGQRPGHRNHLGKPAVSPVCPAWLVVTLLPPQLTNALVCGFTGLNPWFSLCTLCKIHFGSIGIALGATNYMPAGHISFSESVLRNPILAPMVIINSVGIQIQP